MNYSRAFHKQNVTEKITLLWKPVCKGYSFIAEDCDIFPLRLYTLGVPLPRSYRSLLEGKDISGQWRTLMWTREACHSQSRNMQKSPHSTTTESLYFLGKISSTKEKPWRHALAVGEQCWQSAELNALSHTNTSTSKQINLGQSKHICEHSTMLCLRYPNVDLMTRLNHYTISAQAWYLHDNVSRVCNIRHGQRVLCYIVSKHFCKKPGNKAWICSCQLLINSIPYAAQMVCRVHTV